MTAALVSQQFRVYRCSVPRVVYEPGVRERALELLRENPAPTLPEIAKQLEDEQGNGPCVKTIRRWAEAAKIGVPRSRRVDRDGIWKALADPRKTVRVIAEEFDCTERYVRELRSQFRAERRAELAKERERKKSREAHSECA